MNYLLPLQEHRNPFIRSQCKVVSDILKKKSQISENIKALRKIVNSQKLTTTEEQILNNKDTSITKIMLEVERKEKINTNSPWSPDLHIVIQTFTIWKLIKTQIATHISQHFQTK